MKRMTLSWGSVHLFRNEANAKFVPRTAWIDASDVKWVRAMYEVAAMQADAKRRFAYQVANSETEVEPAVAIGNAPTADGFHRGVRTDISAATTGKQLIRFGYLAYNNAADNVLLGIAAGGNVDIYSC